jgi:hypothetical protein
VFFENYFVIDMITKNNKINYCFSGFKLIQYCILKKNTELLMKILNDSCFITYNNTMSDKTYLTELSYSEEKYFYDLVFSHIKFNKSMIFDIYIKSIKNNNVVLFKYLLNKFNFILENNELFNLLIDASPLLIKEFIKKHPEYKNKDLSLLMKLFSKLKKEEIELLLNSFDFFNNPPKLFSIFFISKKKHELIITIYKHMVLKGNYKPELLEHCKFLDTKKEINDFYFSQKINNF